MKEKCLLIPVGHPSGGEWCFKCPKCDRELAVGSYLIVWVMGNTIMGIFADKTMHCEYSVTVPMICEDPDHVKIFTEIAKAGMCGHGLEIIRESIIPIDYISEHQKVLEYVSAQVG